MSDNTRQQCEAFLRKLKRYPEFFSGNSDVIVSDLDLLDAFAREQQAKGEVKGLKRAANHYGFPTVDYMRRWCRTEAERLRKGEE